MLSRYNDGKPPPFFIRRHPVNSGSLSVGSSDVDDPYIKRKIMDKTLLPLLSTIDIYVSQNPESTLHIFLYKNFYQQILQSNRTAFNLAYDPPKLLGHSFSVLDEVDSEKQFFVSNEDSV